jgi:hypothetical protein
MIFLRIASAIAWHLLFAPSFTQAECHSFRTFVLQQSRTTAASLFLNPSAANFNAKISRSVSVGVWFAVSAALQHRPGN